MYFEQITRDFNYKMWIVVVVSVYNINSDLHVEKNKNNSKWRQIE